MEQERVTQLAADKMEAEREIKNLKIYVQTFLCTNLYTVVSHSRVKVLLTVDVSRGCNVTYDKLSIYLSIYAHVFSTSVEG